MAQFLCRYMTKSDKVVEESVEAVTKEEISKSLREKGYKVISIEEQKDAYSKRRSSLKKKTLTLFCRQLSTMLTSGIPMVKCFDVIASQSEDKSLRYLMGEVANEVMAGSSLSAAMRKFPKDFPEMLCEMVKVGEVTGDLNGVLLRMAERYEKEEKINQKIKGALTYPIVVLIVAIAACVFMLIKVVPSFVDVFDSLNADLPVITKILLAVSNFITKRWYILLITLPIIVILLIRFFRLKSVRYVVDKLKVRVVGLKGPMQKLAASRFARTLYTLISSGVPIVQALEYTKKNVLNLYIEEYIDKVILGVRQGRSLSALIAEIPVFPKLLSSMLSVGESSGDLEGMLSKTADYFDGETESAVATLTTILEPLMIILIGLLIGVIVLALYAPMFGAISAMQGAV